MSSARGHQAQAERLLEQARAEQDSIGRAVILAEARVHATLALSGGTGTARPGPGRGDAGDTRRAGQYHPLGTPADPGLTGPQARGGTLPGWGGAVLSPLRAAPPGERGARGVSSGGPRTPYGPRVVTSPWPGGLPDQVPRPAPRPPAPGGPGEEEPGGPGDQEPRGPGVPEPGGPAPFEPVTGDLAGRVAVTTARMM